MIAASVRIPLLQASWRMAAIGLALKLARLNIAFKAGFDPAQPRVAAGNPDGGQWADTGASSAGGALSSRDIAANAKPRWVEGGPGRLRLAQTSSRGGGSRARGVGASEPLTPSQATRLAVSQARADAAVARARNVDPDWSPRPGVSQTAEGQIAHNNAVEREANAHYAAVRTEQVLFGRFTVERTDGPGPFKRPTERQRAEINRIGALYGCHSCGVREPGTRSGGWIFNHQGPSALGGPSAGRWGVPHCTGCSASSGGVISNILWYRRLSQ